MCSIHLDDATAAIAPERSPPEHVSQTSVAHGQSKRSANVTLTLTGKTKSRSDHTLIFIFFPVYNEIIESIVSLNVSIKPVVR